MFLVPIEINVATCLGLNEVLFIKAIIGSFKRV